MRPRRRSTIGPNKKRAVVRRKARRNRLSPLASKPVSRDTVVSTNRTRTAGLRSRVEPRRGELESRLAELRRQGFERGPNETREGDFAGLPMSARPRKYRSPAALNLESGWLYSNIVSALSGRRSPNSRKALRLALSPETSSRLRDYLRKVSSGRLTLQEYLDSALFFRNNVLYQEADLIGRNPGEREGQRMQAAERVELSLLETLRRSPETIRRAQSLGLIGNELTTNAGRDLRRAVLGEIRLLGSIEKYAVPARVVGLFLDAIRKPNGLSETDILINLKTAQAAGWNEKEIARSLGVRPYEPIPEQLETRTREGLEDYRGLRDKISARARHLEETDLRKAQLTVVFADIARAFRAGRITLEDMNLLRDLVSESARRPDSAIGVSGVYNALAYLHSQRSRNRAPDREEIERRLNLPQP